MKKILIIGSNFGAKVYLEAVNKIFPKSRIYLVSPNIKYKKIKNSNVFKFEDYKVLIKKNNFNLVICAATPMVQNDFLNYSISKLKGKKTRLILEKPLSQDIKKILNNLSKLKKNNILFNQNFIFTKLNLWNEITKLNKKRKFSNLKYIWKFKQAYFNNRYSTWKINSNLGGGILFFYMSHTIFNLLIIDSNFKLVKINKIKKTSDMVTFLNLEMKSNKRKAEIEVDINSNIRDHHIFLQNKKYNIGLKNNTKNWTKGFKFLINNKLIKQTNESRIDLSIKSIKELMNYKINSNKYYKFLNLINKTYNILNKINNKVS